MTKAGSITVTIHLAWWFTPYALGLLVMCEITQRRPDPEKLDWWIQRAVRVTTDAG